MRSYFLKRLLLVIPTLLGISIVSFPIIHLAPGDPAELKVDQLELRATADTAEQLKETRELYGLDQPLDVQYLHWLKRIVTLDFGESLRDHRPIIDKVREALPVSLELTGLSLLFAYLSRSRWRLFGHSSPYAGRANHTVLLFGLYSFPISGSPPWPSFIYAAAISGMSFRPSASSPLIRAAGHCPQRIEDQAWHLALPVACLTYYTMAVLSRYCAPACLKSFVRTSSERRGRKV